VGVSELSRNKKTKRATANRKKKNILSYNNEILGIIYFFFGLLVLFGMYFKGSIGVFGEFFRWLFLGIMGTPAFLLPPLIMLYGISRIFKKDDTTFLLRLIYGFVLLVLLSAFIHTALYNPDDYEGMSFFKCIKEFGRRGVELKGGGILGGLISTPFMLLLKTVGTIIVLLALSIIDIIYLTNISLANFIVNLKSMFKKSYKRTFVVIKGGLDEKKKKKIEAAKIDGKEAKRNEKIPEIVNQENDIKEEIIENDTEEFEIEDVKLGINEAKNDGKAADNDISEICDIETEKLSQPQEQENEKKFVYKYPPFELLSSTERNSVDVDKIKNSAIEGARKLEETLKSFQVEAKILKISPGPTITRYELRPSPGVKVRNIVNLADDIALNLASSGVRIEAPIPGKDAIGIEVANKNVVTVYLKDVIESEEFVKHPSKIAFALGKDISGENIIANIAAMPHLLIAGATGSGKSVCINSLIISLLYKSSPEDVKLLMIDPKVVELGIYNGIPHLLVPVVTDPRKASGALNWAVQEMMNRYKLFAEKGVRDLKGYNSAIEEDEECKKLPQIVIIIDELADLMMVAPKEVEDAICRLAQMARAAGIHLVIATQRPSVDVITGVIKANIPSRIAFAVSSSYDSKTILDMTGAETLLGKGDMLYYPVGKSKPVRVQGAFVTDSDVARVVDFVKSQWSAQYDDDIIEHINKEDEPVESSPGDNDELLPKAIELVVETGQASVSFIQRKLGVGYARAGRIIDQMEKRGIIGRAEGSKPRQVLMTKLQWQEMQMKEE